jgi:hypothetical protein
MPAWEKLGLAVLLMFALAGCVLIDSCLEDCTYVDADGNGPDAPIPSFEIASRNSGIQLVVQAAPALPILVAAPVEDVDRPSSVDETCIPHALEPVDPAGWLGRRHFRSPT